MEPNSQFQVLFYVTSNGRCPVEEFLHLLPIKVRAKFAKWIDKLQECGPDLPRPYADIARGKIRELRVIFASGQYRVLYFFHNRNIIITHGFIKKTDLIPEREIERAQNMMLDYEQRVKKGEVES